MFAIGSSLSFFWAKFCTEFEGYIVKIDLAVWGYSTLISGSYEFLLSKISEFYRSDDEADLRNFTSFFDWLSSKAPLSLRPCRGDYELDDVFLLNCISIWMNNLQIYIIIVTNSYK